MSLSSVARAQSLDTAGRFSVGARAGIIPPVWVVPELAVRVVPHFTLGAFGLYLPSTTNRATNDGHGSETTVAGQARYEGAGREGHGPFLQLCLQYYREGVSPHHDWNEKDLFTTVTAGYQWRWRHFETQIGGGLLVFTQLNKPPPPPPGDWNFDLHIDVPVALPTAELALRYRF